MVKSCSSKQATDQVTAIRSGTLEVMTLTEAAIYAGCSSRKLRDLVYACRVKHARVGNRIKIRRCWLDEFLDHSGT